MISATSFVKKNYLLIIYFIVINSVFWNVIYISWLMKYISCKPCNYLAIALAMIFMFVSVFWLIGDLFSKIRWWTFPVLLLIFIVFIVLGLSENFFFGIPLLYVTTFHLAIRLSIRNHGSWQDRVALYLLIYRL